MSCWKRYIAYLKKWADEHSDEKFKGMSPAGYDEWLENEDFIRCPEGGDASNDCEGCVYGEDYHFVDGECVLRTKEPSESKFEAPEEVHR